VAAKTRKYTRSVADFMAANRCAGRYLVATAQGEASYGAANVIAQFELFFLAGFTYAWWLTFNNIVWLFILLSGFIIYRYRESRVMTLAQFFEIRYSKAFRVFAGCLVFFSGILAYGIYPAVGARFFVYFLGMPESFEVLGTTVSTFIPLMALLLLPGILLTTMGGQLTLMVVDCLEGIISLLFYLCIAAALMWMFTWSDISTAMQRPDGNSLFNPFNAGQNKDFGFWYVMIAIFINAYGWQSSQVGHGFRGAAINAHEQKMGAILGPWRNEVRTLMLTVLCICAIAFLNSPAGSVAVSNTLAGVENPALQNQLRTPIALGLMLPPAIKGMFTAIMLFALVATDCTMMHSWGTIFVQDIVVPLRKRPMEPHQHVWLLRIAVIGVAVFAFLFSALLPQTTYINMFLAIVGAITAGLGACIIGGFYWKRGTTAAAWAAMISGALVSVTGEVLTQTWKRTLYPWLSANHPALLEKTNYVLQDVISATIPNLNWHIEPNGFFLNRMWIACFAVIAAIVSYLVGAWLTYRQDFNLDRMLYRGPYAIAGEEKIAASANIRQRFSFNRLIGITPEFTTADRAISLSLFGYRILWFVVFMVIVLWNIPTSWRWPEHWWINFWRVTSIWLPFVIALIMVVWFTWGGLKDIGRLFVRLRQVSENPLDDGTVVGHHNLAEAGDPAVRPGTGVGTSAGTGAGDPRP
jgi:SSS family solute:Na+ symporter